MQLLTQMYRKTHRCVKTKLNRQLVRAQRGRKMSIVEKRERERNKTWNGRDRWPHFTVMTNIVMRTQFYFQLLVFIFILLNTKKNKKKRESEHDSQQ